jgi:catechol 2,3-dioxygenase-like lactoylglutathione lyase family enzyme
MKAIFKNAWPYREDKLNLPVKDLESALPFYQTKLNFQVDSRKDTPFKSALLSRDQIQIGLSENGGDPTQDGCFFEVDDVEKALEELKSNGLKKEKSDLNMEQHGQASWKVFYVVAPDGLCYCIGQKQN